MKKFTHSDANLNIYIYCSVHVAVYVFSFRSNAFVCNWRECVDNIQSERNVGPRIIFNLVRTIVFSTLCCRRDDNDTDINGVVNDDVGVTKDNNTLIHIRTHSYTHQAKRYNRIWSSFAHSDTIHSIEISFWVLSICIHKKLLFSFRFWDEMAQPSSFSTHKLNRIKINRATNKHTQQSHRIESTVSFSRAGTMKQQRKKCVSKHSYVICT